VNRSPRVVNPDVVIGQRMILGINRSSDSRGGIAGPGLVLGVVAVRPSSFCVRSQLYRRHVLIRPRHFHSGFACDGGRLALAEDTEDSATPALSKCSDTFSPPGPGGGPSLPYSQTNTLG